MVNSPWTDQQNDHIVANYFAMLKDDILGRPYNKAENNRNLQQQISRGAGSIEYKHQNISAILKGLGECWIVGYKPAFNFQSSLIDAVGRWLGANPDWLLRAPGRQETHQIDEISPLWVGPAPTIKNAPPPDETEQMTAIARHFDAAGQAERNRLLGRAGEHRALAHERSVLVGAGRTDLADKIVWTSDVEGDGAGYDISSFTIEGEPRLIEVKTTNGWERTPFHISRNELKAAEQRHSEWCLLRIWNFEREPLAFEIRPPLGAHVELTATSFQANFL